MAHQGVGRPQGRDQRGDFYNWRKTGCRPIGLRDEAAASARGREQQAKADWKVSIRWIASWPASCERHGRSQMPSSAETGCARTWKPLPCKCGLWPHTLRAIVEPPVPAARYLVSCLFKNASICAPAQPCSRLVRSVRRTRAMARLYVARREAAKTDSRMIEALGLPVGVGGACPPRQAIATRRRS
jgi:hypothetical protein